MKRRQNGRNRQLRDLESHVYAESLLTGEFRDFIREEILPRLNLKGYRLPEQRRIAAHCIHNLVVCGLVGACVADSRNNAEPGTLRRIKIWDRIVAAGFAKFCRGSEYSQKTSRYAATRRLLSLRKTWQLELVLNLRLQRNTETDEVTAHALVIFKDDAGDLVNIRQFVEQRAQRNPDGSVNVQAVENGMSYWRAIEDLVERINRAVTSHSLQAFTIDPETGREFVRPVNPCLRQIHTGSPPRTARLYCWGPLSVQLMSKQQRKSILIDGEQVAELDFSCMAIRMLYHLKRFDPKGDLYRPERIMRKYYRLANASDDRKASIRGFVKTATNICLNAASRRSAFAAVRTLLDEHPDKKFLWKLLNNTEQITLGKVISRIVRAHPKLQKEFFSGIGCELMTIDGKIMLQILDSFVLKHGRPALAIHDAIVCKVADVELAERVMVETYRKFFPFPPIVKREF